MRNCIVRILADFIPKKSWRDTFRERHLHKNIDNMNMFYDKFNELNNKLNYLTDFVKSTTDITKVPRANGDLRLVQMGGAKLLKVIHEICAKHGLKYWIMYGSLIGAVRHAGYIPWDDDIDICMLRDDYNKMIKILGNGKQQKTNGYITYNLADILKIFYKDSPARVDVFPFEQYYKAANTLAEKEQLIADMDDARKKIVWDWNKLETFWPDVIPTSPQSYEEKLNIQKKLVMKNKKNVSDGILFKGIDVWDRQPLEQLLNVDDVFPLKQTLFEGYMLNIPNNALEIVNRQYGDIYKFPHDMAPHHALLEKASRKQLNLIHEFLDMDIKEILNAEEKNETK